MNNALPLDGLRVVEFTHMVMGPACGLMLADLGADVIKVEPPGGDKTRYLNGSGAGYFPMYNRNKRSICLDVKSESGKAAALRLIDTADVFIENFRPGAMDRAGFGYEALNARNPQLIYCSEKGFLDGPYAQRAALDEVAQMMSGLAYMTGPPGKPLRAGASVIDVQGGMFGALGVLAALYQRKETHRGQHVTASLFESAVFLVGQHMAQMAVTGKPADPMPARISAWAIYDVFETADGQPVFVGVVTDGQWKIFCKAFALDELAADISLQTNAERVYQRSRIIPIIKDTLVQLTKAELLTKLEKIGLPFAPINRPQDMFDDVHMNASGALLEISLPDGDNRGETTKLPALPLRMGAQRLGLRRDVPRFGEDTEAILVELGYSAKEIALLNVVLE
jgi:crotonobetainyl-CoA:carnitine CoA-transferase CaiB-like acyl-CoA transferase